MSDRTCPIPTADGEPCGRPSRTKTDPMCGMHNMRARRHGGDPNAGVDRREGINNYQVIHKKVKALHGLASGYACVDCGDPARQWSLCAEPIGEIKIGLTGSNYAARYSTEVSDYEPRCTPCHRKMDSKRGEQHHVAKLTNAQVLEIFRRLKTESSTQLAVEFGVSKGTVDHIKSGIAWSSVTGMPQRVPKRRPKPSP